MKVAVGSSDGKVVNAHFGRTPQFLIFEVDGKGFVLIEVRKNNPGCSNLNDPHGSMEDTIELIKDCEYVLVSRIGPAMITRLLDVSVVAKVVPNLIEDALMELVEGVRS